MASAKKPKRGKYDWDNWFKQTKFTLVKGRHYACSQSAMQIQIRNRASVNGIKVSIVDKDNSLVVVVTDRGARL